MDALTPITIEQIEKPPIENPLNLKTNYQRFHHYLKDLESPTIFIDWNFYFLIASCLGRKVWLMPDWRIYPNIYVVYVAEPGFGKGLPMVKVSSILRDIIDPSNGKKLINIAPSTVSFEKMTKRIAAAETESPLASGIKPDYHHSSVVFTIAELATLFRDNSCSVNDLVNFLHCGYDCESDYEDDTIKHGSVKVRNMCINFAACCTPNWIGRKSEALVLTEGWNSRTIYVYGNEKRQYTTFYFTSESQIKALVELMVHLRALATIPAGPLNLEKSIDAINWIDDWYRNKIKDHVKNPSPYLIEYYNRKKLHLTKLAILNHYAESVEPFIEISNCLDALKILEATEVNMHHSFAATNSKNPLYSMAEEMLRLIEKRGGELSYLDIVDKMFSKGDGDQIDKAVEWLRITGKIEAFDNKINGRRMFKTMGNITSK